MIAAAEIPHPNQRLPLVSCLTVTMGVPERLGHLKRSLREFAAQTYALREMIVVVDGGCETARAAIRGAVAALSRTDIKVVEPAGKQTLGALRNLAVREARGQLLCTWDDDDFYHPERLERQVQALLQPGVNATALTEVIQFFPAERRIYLTNWMATPMRVVAGTVMWRRTALVDYPEDGEAAKSGEDMVMLSQLHARGGFHLMDGLAYLYVYVCHSVNITGQAHHRMLVEKLSISKGMIRRREADLRAGLSAHDFGAGELVFEGNNGPAFIVQT